MRTGENSGSSNDANHHPAPRHESIKLPISSESVETTFIPGKIDRCPECDSVVSKKPE